MSPSTAARTRLIAATFTPLGADGALALAKVPELVEHVLAGGVDGLFVCGSTGEGASLACDERRAVTEATLAAVAGRVPVYVHVGHNSLAEARALARHAAGAGAAAIAAAPPSYFRPAGVEALVDCLAGIAAGAPDTPLFYYHIPRLTGVPLAVRELLELAPARLPSLAGVKYSELTLDDLLACAQEHGARYELLFGADEMLLAGLACGAVGAVGSTYCFLAPLYRRVIDAFEAGELDEARRQQHHAVRLVREILRYPALPALKAAMRVAGVDCGPPRLPLRALDADEERALAAALRRAGLFEHAAR